MANEPRGEDIILDRIPFSVLIVNSSMHVVWANKNWLEKTHRHIRDVVGVRVTELFPESMVNYMSLELNLRSVFRTGKTFTGTPLTYRAPGTTSWIYSYVISLLDAGYWREHVFLLLEDITEKMQLMEKTRSVSRHLTNVVEHAHDLIISTDKEGRIISWNPSAERLTGFTEAEIKGHSLTELFNEGGKDAITDIILRLNKLEVIRDKELDLRSHSGKIAPIAWSFSPISAGTGSVEALVAIGRDLSERRAFEMQLFQTEKLAALGVMAGGIAHEIRNPLAVCFSCAQFLKTELPDSASSMQEIVTKMIDSIQRASTIIEALLRFAKPSDTNRLMPIDIVQIVKETVDLIAAQVVLRGIRISQDYPSSCLTVMGNSSLLQQVVMNLVLNAQQAMPDGGDLAISIHQEGENAVICISDTGHGIAADNIGKIFDPFFTTRPHGEGTGLGLAVSYAIIQQHLGSIDAFGSAGKGSTFTVRIPLVDQHAE